jgi:hypothetical protein
MMMASPDLPMSAPYVRSSTSLFLLAAIALLQLSCNADSRVPQAIARFHELSNRGDSEQIYSEAGEEFREKASLEAFIRMMESIERSSGPFEQTDVKSVRAKWLLKGRYKEALCHSRYHKRTLEEYFNFRVRDGEVELVGYFVRDLDAQGSHSSPRP